LSRRLSTPRDHAVWHHTWVLHSGDEPARRRVSSFNASDVSTPLVAENMFTVLFTGATFSL